MSASIPTGNMRGEQSDHHAGHRGDNVRRVVSLMHMRKNRRQKPIPSHGEQHARLPVNHHQDHGGQGDNGGGSYPVTDGGIPDLAQDECQWFSWIGTVRLPVGRPTAPTAA